MLTRQDYVAKVPGRKAAQVERCDRCALTQVERDQRHKGKCPLHPNVADLCPDSPLAGHYLHQPPKAKPCE